MNSIIKELKLVDWNNDSQLWEYKGKLYYLTIDAYNEYRKNLKVYKCSNDNCLIRYLVDRKLDISEIEYLDKFYLDNNVVISVDNTYPVQKLLEFWDEVRIQLLYILE